MYSRWPEYSKKDGQWQVFHEPPSHFVFVFLFIRPAHSGAHTKKENTERISFFYFSGTIAVGLLLTVYIIFWCLLTRAGKSEF